jgi:hypothetical protein
VCATVRYESDKRVEYCSYCYLAVLRLYFEPMMSPLRRYSLSLSRLIRVLPTPSRRFSHFELYTMNTICSCPAFSPAQHKRALLNTSVRCSTQVRAAQHKCGLHKTSVLYTTATPCRASPEAAFQWTVMLQFLVNGHSSLFGVLLHCYTCCCQFKTLLQMFPERSSTKTSIITQNSLSKNRHVAVLSQR